MKPEKIWNVADVFGINRDLPVNYVVRPNVDNKFIDNLTRDHHVVIYGSSKQGKTCLRKNCLEENDYVVVSCSNNMDLRQLHSLILKSVGYVVQESNTRTVDGKAKIEARFQFEFGLPGLIKKTGGAGVETGGTVVRSEKTNRLELDPGDVNEIIFALKEVEFAKFIVLEDFHYLPIETQQNFSYALKAFHENSKITFIVVAVWREENRLILFNGDLTGRVVAIDADAWTETQLAEVVNVGEGLMNIAFPTIFVSDLIRQSAESVYIVQEACHRACKDAGVHRTSDSYLDVIPLKSASNYVYEIVREQSGRYKSFLQNFSLGFQTTELEMYKWILFPVLTTNIDSLEKGLSYRAIRKSIESRHSEGSRLKPGNLTQALSNVSNLQIRKNIKPFVLDYDSANLLLSVVDKGFLVWLDSQDREELFELIELPSTDDV